MKLKLFVMLIVALGYLMMTVACQRASSPSSSTMLPKSEAALSSSDSPHAVDITGKAIPESSATQPDQPIILAKDSNDGKWGELKPEAAFNHAKHTTDLRHSLDGKTLTVCTECHHTEQPSAPAGQEYLKRFERKETLTAQQLESSKQPVKSCRMCHLQSSAEETDEFPPEGVAYPKKSGKPPSGKLTNDNAYHINCISCHDAAIKRDLQLKAPQGCIDCHKKLQ